MKNLKSTLLLLALATVLHACNREGGSVENKTVYEVDHSDPVKVLQAVFDVAKGADAAVLGELCDPLGKNDGDTRRICDLSSGFESNDEFVLYFRNARINGEAVVDGTLASVPFLFGPDGDREESMELVQRDGKWYLSAF
jgi:hypothetical protein